MRPLSPLLALAALALSGAALADGCDAVLAAAKKLDSVPYRMHSETVALGQADSEPEVADMVATKDKLYFDMDGEWQSVPRDMSGLDQIDDELASGDVSCRQLDDAELNGVAAAIFAIEDRSQPDVAGQTVWIGKESGLMLRAQEQFDAGAGDDGKSQTTIDFSFDGVVAPAGVE